MFAITPPSELAWLGSVACFKFFQMGQQFVFVGPTDQVVAQHLVRAFGRLAAGPEVDQQAGDDRAVRLNLDPVRVMAQSAAADRQPSRCLSVRKKTSIVQRCW